MYVIVGRPKHVKTSRTLPSAAEMPWQVARDCVGKISEGMMKVVVLGPKSGADGRVDEWM